MTTPDPVREALAELVAAYRQRLPLRERPELWAAAEAALSAPPPQVPDAAAIRAAAIEECAALCDERAKPPGPKIERGEAILCAAYIRALAASPPPNTPAP